MKVIHQTDVQTLRLIRRCVIVKDAATLKLAGFRNIEEKPPVYDHSAENTRVIQANMVKGFSFNIMDGCHITSPPEKRNKHVVTDLQLSL